MLIRRFPDFFVIGAPKCGTTALFEYLCDHPSVFRPRIKEPHYFCMDFPAHRQCRDLESYLELFSGASAAQITGEASVWYMYSHVAVQEIIKARPDAKIIIMLRSPVDMARSLHAQLLIELNDDILDFEEAWRAQADRAVGKRLPFHTTEPSLIQYGEVCSFSAQIERVFRFVPRQQIHILLYEEFFADPAKGYREILDFLDLPFDGRKQFARINTGRSPGNLKVYRFLSAPPFPLNVFLGSLRALSQKYDLHLGALMHRFFKRAYEIQPGKRDQIRAGFEEELREFFAKDIARLEELLGRRLDIWKRKVGEETKL